jgi:hypothetical protein
MTLLTSNAGLNPKLVSLPSKLMMPKRLLKWLLNGKKIMQVTKSTLS